MAGSPAPCSVPPQSVNPLAKQQASQSAHMVAGPGLCYGANTKREDRHQHHLSVQSCGCCCSAMLLASSGASSASATSSSSSSASMSSSSGRVSAAWLDTGSRTHTLWKGGGCASWRAQPESLEKRKQLVAAGGGRRRGGRATRKDSMVPWLQWSSFQPKCGVLFMAINVLCGSILPVVEARTGRAHYNMHRKEQVCKTVDIRNRVPTFSKLDNCTVIEGHLSILLIDYADSTEYRHLSFPKLVEVTDYVLLYRVYGLRSLSNIFPNLAVIHGQELFHNYALVVFEMPNFEEIGLHGLTKIVRGAVRIEKNPSLCYIDTIDWTRITQVKQDDNFIIQNKDVDECVNVCPRRPAGAEDRCPESEIVMSDGSTVHQPLCWTSQHCQKVCEDVCGSRFCYKWKSEQGKLESRCCHDECLGGCTGPNPTQCVACQNVFYGDSCIKKCPYGTYEHLKRRCVTETECRNMGQQMPIYWKVLQAGLCVRDCPSGYTESKEDRNRCIRCNGPCPKVCASQVIDSVAAAQKMKGCTQIEGPLEIQIRGGSHVGAELEANLGMIEEVTHYVKIVRSYAILSLRFLKNLRVIRGNRLQNDRYALFVLDNQNLQDIWDFQMHPNLTIVAGHVFFHHNRKLCLFLIEELISFVWMQNKTDEMDISLTTNGDQVACDVSQLTLESVSVNAGWAIVRWTNFHTTDHRKLLGWVLNYRHAPERNITMFNARDACGTDDWKTQDVRPGEEKNAKWIATILFPLKPNTQYAVYVETYTIATAKRGAISSIMYMITKPAAPSTARDIKVQAVTSRELYVTWEPPSQPKGNVTHYYVYWQAQPLKAEKFDQRNYCFDKLRLPSDKHKTVIEEEEESANKTVGGRCCKCPKADEEEPQHEQERMFQIEFEDYLHGSVYVKHTLLSNDGRRKRSAFNNFAYNSSLGILDNDDLSMNLSQINQTDDLLPAYGDEDDLEPYEAAVVYGKSEVVLPNLRHFTEYSIEVIACHEYQEGMDRKLCSNRAITTTRTAADETADTIDPRNVTVVNFTDVEQTGNVWIRWPDPPSPNGIVVNYEVEMIRVDVSNLKPDIYCIPHVLYRQNSGFKTSNHDKPLNSGNWSFRIRTTSLAGNGSWTPHMYFYIPHVALLSTFNGELIAGMCAFAALLLIIIVVSVICVVARKRLQPGIPDGVLVASVNPEYWSGGDLYVADEWEVSRDKVQLLRELGQGSFGMVYEGTASDLDKAGIKGTIKVAIKTVNENANIRDRIEFLNEGSVMKSFNGEHVVKLLGVVSKGQPTLVLMELMANGDLKSFLRKHRPEENCGAPAPSLQQILQMAGEIADGMAYLAAKKYVHRDLAARNCMVSENLVVKIGDFGMTRDVIETDYYRKEGKGLLPVRWMAPESLKDGIFNSQSDVWSYGVVLWEMATLAAQPYQGLANEQVLKWVIDGGTMERPEGCPDMLYDLMMMSWRHSSRERPTFCEIIEMLVPDLRPSFREDSFFFSEENRDLMARAKEKKEMKEKEAEAEAEEEEEEEEEDDLQEVFEDSQTPLTGSPVRHRWSERLGDVKPIRHRDGEVDLDAELDKIDVESHRSSLSSFHSEPVDAREAPRGHSHNNKAHHPGGEVSAEPSERVELISRDNKAKYVPHDANPSTGEPQWGPKQHSNSWNHANSNGPSAINSNEGSKSSTKSSDSNHSSGRNGMVNGHGPWYIAPPKC